MVVISQVRRLKLRNTENIKLLVGYSKEEIEKKIDDFLLEGINFIDTPLILPVSGASRYIYKGISVRQWYKGDDVRYDSAVEIESK